MKLLPRCFIEIRCVECGMERPHGQDYCSNCGSEIAREERLVLIDWRYWTFQAALEITIASVALLIARMDLLPTGP